MFIHVCNYLFEENISNANDTFNNKENLTGLLFFLRLLRQHTFIALQYKNLSESDDA